MTIENVNVKELFIDDLKRQISSLRATLRNLEGTLDYYQGLSFEETRKPASLRDAAYNILKEEGRPLTRQVVFDKITHMGIDIPGQQPLNNVTAHMSNDARIESLGNNLWALREWRQQHTKSGAAIVRQADSIVEEITSLSKEAAENVTLNREPIVEVTINSNE